MPIVDHALQDRSYTLMAYSKYWPVCFGYNQSDRSVSGYLIWLTAVINQANDKIIWSLLFIWNYRLSLKKSTTTLYILFIYLYYIFIILQFIFYLYKVFKKNIEIELKTISLLKHKSNITNHVRSVGLLLTKDNQFIKLVYTPKTP